MTKQLQVFIGHLLITLLVLSIITFATLSWWNPKPYMGAEGGGPVLMVFILVVIVVGPVLTLLLYKPGKKGLLLDMMLIGIFQITAIVFGTYTLYEKRPVFLVFAVDRFILVSKDDIDTSKLGSDILLPGFNQKPISIYARLPENAKKRSQLLQEVFSGKPDVEFRAEYYEPMSSNILNVVSHSINADSFGGNTSVAGNLINDFVNQHCSTVEKCAYFPLVGKKKDILLVLNREDGKVVGAVDVDPWKLNDSN